MSDRLLEKVLNGMDLTREEAGRLMERMIDGGLTSAKTASWLTALRMKGESVEELAGFAEVLRQRAVRVHLTDPDAVDTCGTGGDGGRTFNISTAAAIVAASAGVTVAKHGNRAVSGKTGSADVLEALGVEIPQHEKLAERMLRKTGIAFLHAPLYHRALKRVGPIRRELGFRTVFNLLGPLVNPAGVKRQLVGVFHPRLTSVLARVLGELGAHRAMVVSGFDGLDEITVTGPSLVSEWRDGRVYTYEVSPEDVGLSRWRPEEIRADSPRESAHMILKVLGGESGAPRDAVLLNAGAVLMMADRASTLEEGVRLAADAVDSGRALRRLENWARISREVRHIVS
ncbi:anthranilate phosphoribosyltransferase [Staphylospora marina]|uniref:anthranilate phosphoribosyltransferase n=1 Tax=Staphylospora marina TaxID=2490858 RepID=UPI000F5C0FB9|nr:anthranilate phosphoribosyltransferase [Staphylospora marina]